MPVVYYRQLKSVAYGRSAEVPALDGQLIKAKELEEIAAKKKYNGSENEEGAVRRLFLFRTETFGLASKKPAQSALLLIRKPRSLS